MRAAVREDTGDNGSGYVATADRNPARLPYSLESQKMDGVPSASAK